MLAYVSRANGVARLVQRALAAAIVGGLMACAPQDVAGPHRDPISKEGAGSAPSLPPLPPLVPWIPVQPPTWAPSDLRGSLLISQSETVFRVAPDSAVPRRILSLPNWPYAVNMSPDGTRVATLHFDQFSHVLCVTHAGVLGANRCVRVVGGGLAALTWTPDGQALVLGGGATADGQKGARLSIIDPVTLTFRTLLPDDGNLAAQSVSFTPDSRTISFVFDQQLWRMPTDGNGVPQLQPGFESLRNLSAARWSPDGKSIALQDDYTLSVANADGRNHRVLVRLVDDAPMPSQMYSPVWSPNSEWLGFTLFEWLVQRSAYRIVIVSVGGNGSRVLSHEGQLHDWR